MIDGKCRQAVHQYGHPLHATLEAKLDEAGLFNMRELKTPLFKIKPENPQAGSDVQIRALMEVDLGHAFIDEITFGWTQETYTHHEYFGCSKHAFSMDILQVFTCDVRTQRQLVQKSNKYRMFYPWPMTLPDADDIMLTRVSDGSLIAASRLLPGDAHEVLVYSINEPMANLIERCQWKAHICKSWGLTRRSKGSSNEFHVFLMVTPLMVIPLMLTHLMATTLMVTP